MRRWIFAVALLIAMPFWCVYWVDEPPKLIFLMAVVGYTAVIILATIWAEGCFDRQVRDHLDDKRPAGHSQRFS